MAHQPQEPSSSADNTSLPRQSTTEGWVPDSSRSPVAPSSSSPKQRAEVDSPVSGCIQRVLRCAAQALFHSLTAPDDDFHTQMHKSMCVIFLLCSPYPLTLAIYYIVVREVQHDPGAGVICWIVAGLLATAVWIVPWVYVRLVRVAPKVLMDLTVGVFNVALLLAAIGTTQTPVQIGCVLNSVFAALAATQLFPLHVTWSIITLFVQIYNESYEGSGHFLLMVKTRRVGPPAENLLMLMGGLCATIVLAVGMRFVTSLLLRHGQAAADTVKLTQIAAAKLNNYDTDGVREVLAAYESKGAISAELIDSFKMLVEQLERYKPHLPNWVLQEAAEAQDEEEPSAASESSSDRHRQSSPRLESRASSCPTPSGDVSSSSSSSYLSSSGLGQHRTEPANSLRRQRCSLASFHLRIESREKGLTAVAAELNALVDALHDWGSATHGAIHSLMGDVVSVSWNAISRTAQPEVNACRFACRLSRHCRRGMRAGGAIFTGDAVVGMAGTKQMLPTMERPAFEAALQYAAAFGRRHNVMVACSRTMATAGLVIDGYPAEAVACIDEAGKRSEWVLSVVEGEKAQEDDEWMYTLEKQHGSSPAATTHQAMKVAIQEKDFGKAAQLMATVPPTYFQQRPLLAMLRDRVEAQLRDPRDRDVGVGPVYGDASSRPRGSFLLELGDRPFLSSI